MLRIGTAGWSLPAESRDRFPEGDSHLGRYSRVLNCTEINSSFHRPHRRATYERWAQSVPDDFRFSLKLPKSITHEKRCHDCRDDLVRFLNDSSPLAQKRAVLLVQLPPKLAFDERLFERFFADMRSLYDRFLACEPRHPSWFTADADALMNAYHVARVAADPSRSDAGVSSGGWPGLAYFRLHGSPRVYYSRYESEAVATFATQLASNEAPEKWCIFDNTAAGAAIENALELKEMLSA